MFRRLVLSVVALSCAWSVEAACSGTGKNRTCTANSTSAQIEAAISSAGDEAIITIQAGTFSDERVNLDGVNGVTIICETTPLTQGAATVNPCIASSSRPFWVSGSTGTITNLIRVSGFRFTGTGANVIDLNFSSGNPGLTLENFRIDHNTFLAQDGYTIALAHNQSTVSKYGVIDHNYFTDTAGGDAQMIFHGAGDNDWGPTLAGTGNCVFIEDNLFEYSDERLAGSGGDGQHGGCQVWRYNTMTNNRISVHGRCHNGPVNLEAYGNTIVSDEGFRILHHQGSGEMFWFNNTLTGADTVTIALQHYRSTSPSDCAGTCNGSQGIDGNRQPEATYEGYPCDRQPGRTGDDAYRPVVVFNNIDTSDGSLVGLDVSGDDGDNTLLPLHMQSDRDWYEGVSANAQTSSSSPFDGTTGVGFGLLSRRPSTCTTSDETGLGAGDAGVMYFATDQGTQGVLYTCSATNTWSVYYTPYTYPHPLVGEEDEEEEQGPTARRLRVRMASADIPTPELADVPTPDSFEAASAGAH